MPAILMQLKCVVRRVVPMAGIQAQKVQLVAQPVDCSIVALTVFAEDDDKAVIYGLLVEERIKGRVSKMDGREMI